MYVGKETYHITSIFRHTDIQITFRTNSTIQNLLTQRKPDPDKFSSSGVYKLTCPECNKACVGQTGRRFSLHKRAFYNNSPSSFAQHLDEAHPFGPIRDIMQVLHHHSKGPHLNTMEKFYIYAEYINRSHLNYEHTIIPNKIFDSLIKPSSLRTPPAPRPQPTRTISKDCSH
jgi:hypothetical protein